MQLGRARELPFRTQVLPFHIRALLNHTREQPCRARELHRCIRVLSFHGRETRCASLDRRGFTGRTDPKDKHHRFLLTVETFAGNLKAEKINLHIVFEILDTTTGSVLSSGSKE